MLPTEEQALQFAIMLQAGLPPSEAILYFLDQAERPEDVAVILRKWQGSRAVKKAMSKLLSKPWHELSLDERIRAALDQHYSGLAYLLYSASYQDANQGEKSKLDTARASLEAKLAGTAGKSDALSQFFADINEGKVKLSKPVPIANLKLQ
jgi:hypothetical protein